MVRVIEDRTVDEIASIQPFLRVGVESDPNAGAAEKRKKAADSREKLTVNHGVDVLLTQLHQGPHGVTKEPPKGSITQRKDIFTRNDIQRLQETPVLFKKEDINGGIRILCSNPCKHGSGEDQTAHFGEEDNKDLAGFLNAVLRVASAWDQGEDPAKNDPEDMIDATLNVEIQWVMPLDNTRTPQRIFA